ncbi:hypothetical protein T07_7599 [Trichinella nelsoni]|uniref:Uncharacterized protein n=1 Tax=Trichinella nelsoni TaxID=6336 RepID=A0A0V0S513_9BILA|nr:hypothetical protein T07_7599 [Trichinella nelsoni]
MNKLIWKKHEINLYKLRCVQVDIIIIRSHGVTASTLDSESSNPSSNLGGTSLITIQWFHGVTASTLDFESSNPSSNLGGT